MSVPMIRVIVRGGKWEAQTPGCDRGGRYKNQDSTRQLFVAAMLIFGNDEAMASSTSTPPIVQLTSRGQITLPASVRRELGVRSGDPLVVSVEDGRIVLQPAVVVPVELYSDERVREFEENSSLTDEELAAAKDAWGL